MDSGPLFENKQTKEDSPSSFEADIPSQVDQTTARKIALDLLMTVLEQKQPLDQVLDRHTEYRALESRDRRFVRMIVSTTLRRMGQIDDMILKASDRDEFPHPPVLLNLLRMAVAQIVFMVVPDYAVVDTAVGIAKENGLSRQKDFVNAVLRRITREASEWRSKQDESRLNVPEWLMKIWIADYGLRTAAEIALASLAEAPLDITLKNQEEAESWLEKLDAKFLPTGSLRRDSGGGVTALSGFEEGAWWVQDAAAAMPVKLLGDVRGKTVLDLCAAPGGKTAQLAAAGANVLAIDRSAKRMQRLEENMQRLKLSGNVTPIIADAEVWTADREIDMVLLDAPCTATGTIRRHPDVLQLKTERDLVRLSDLQSRLLDSAGKLLKSGGVLIYCTCSLQKVEGEHQIDKFLQRHPEFARLPVTNEEISGLETVLTESGDVRLFPFHLAAQGGMDGFFIARLIRK